MLREIKTEKKIQRFEKKIKRWVTFHTVFHIDRLIEKIRLDIQRH